MKLGNVFNPTLLILLAAAFMLAGCVVAPPPTEQDAPGSPLGGATPTSPTEVTPTGEMDAISTPGMGNTPTPEVVQLPDGGSYNQYAEPPLMTIDPEESYTASVRTDEGTIVIDLFASETPVTVNNFVFLAQEGFYDDVIFHRVVEGFMVQTGDPRGDGTGGPGYRFDDEPVNRSYNRGTVAMANAGPNTNGSQFFIVQGTEVDLPPNYTIFGEVTAGMEVVDAIASAEVEPTPLGEMSSPVSPVTIQTIEISTES